MTLVPEVPFLEKRHGETVKAATTHDIGALSDEVVELTYALELSDDERAQALLSDAVDCFERSERAFDGAEEPNDFAEVTAAIGRSRYLLACVRARLEHTSLPDQMQPCFFDPRHGPAARHIVWAPPSGDPRTVPACAYDAELIEADVQPEPRRLAVGEELIPYWDAPLFFVPWFSGYFESVRGCAAADLLAGMPLGEGFMDSTEPEDRVITRQEIRDRWLDLPDTEED